MAQSMTMHTIEKPCLTYIDRLENSNIIVRGDFNFIFNFRLDKTEGTDKTRKKCRR